MLNIQALFEVPGYDDWLKQLERDLQPEDFQKLSTEDEIEELHIRAHAHASLLPESSKSPGEFPFTRGFNKKDNHWNNGFEISVEDESTANKKALEVLMKGCDLLIFDLQKDSVDFQHLLSEIGLE